MSLVCDRFFKWQDENVVGVALITHRMSFLLKIALSHSAVKWSLRLNVFFSRNRRALEREYLNKNPKYESHWRVIIKVFLKVKK